MVIRGGEEQSRAGFVTRDSRWRREWDSNLLRVRVEPHEVPEAAREAIAWRQQDSCGDSRWRGSIASSNRDEGFALAEGVGFEPTGPHKRPTGFRDQRLRPLGHPSNEMMTRFVVRASAGSVGDSPEATAVWSGRSRKTRKRRSPLRRAGSFDVVGEPDFTWFDLLVATHADVGR